MKEIKYRSESIECPCGENIYVELESDIESTLCPSDGLCTDSDEVTCPKCKMSYEIELTMKMTVTIERAKITAIGDIVASSTGQPLSLNLLKMLSVGDRANSGELCFLDGVYTVEEKMYYINNGFITEIWAAPDKNQLSLFEEAI